MNTEELKPCPFCGGEAVSEETITDNSVRCQVCHGGVTIDNDAIGHSVRIWNMRAKCEDEELDEWLESARVENINPLSP